MCGGLIVVRAGGDLCGEAYGNLAGLKRKAAVQEIGQPFFSYTCPLIDLKINFNNII
jgi:hypothetical protein